MKPVFIKVSLAREANSILSRLRFGSQLRGPQSKVNLELSNITKSIGWVLAELVASIGFELRE